MSFQVQSQTWVGEVGMEDAFSTVAINGDFDVTWSDKGDLVLNFGFYESEDFPVFLRLLATAVEQAIEKYAEEQ